MPVHTYLGGAMKDRILFNAWIGIQSPDDAAKETLGWQQQGCLAPPKRRFVG